MNESVVMVICGLILLVATFLVFQEYTQYYFVKISFSHPWDYVAHFVTCFVGVIFFFILMQKSMYNFETSLIVSVFIMLFASLFKECRIDPRLSVGDMVSNIIGMMVASRVLFSAY